MSSSSPQPFGPLLASLLITSGYARKNHSPDWVRFVARVPDVSYETLRKAVTSERAVSEELMRRVARALSVEPTVFIEYRLIQARRALDPSQVGWARVTDALVSWEEWRDARSPSVGSDETTE